MTFYFVNPENRDQHRELMQDYFERLAKVWGAIGLDKYDTQSASYVVCTHPKFGVIGGVRLLPTLGPKLSDDSLAESGLSLFDKETWEASKLFFYLPPDDAIHENPDEFERICFAFYQGLWDYFQEICDLEMIVTLLPEPEHTDASFFGSWPFQLESTVRNPFNINDEEYILGVLKLGEQEEFDLAG